MTQLKRWQSATALFVTLTFGGVTAAPVITSVLTPAPAVAQTARFRDVPSNHWAAPFINALVERGIVAGFPDGTFKPNDPVTRAQFAAMVQNAFDQPNVRGATNFRDVSTNYWARPAIQEAYRMGFLSGYPNNIFRPTQNIPKEQVLVALANGLNYQASRPTNEILTAYNDRGSISNFALTPIAAATERNLVVNYPNLQQLNPRRNTSRAEVAAMIYQALVQQGQAQRVNSQYIVQQTPVGMSFRIPAGVELPLAYNRERILVTGEETIDLTLTMAADITTNDGELLIPAGTAVEGTLRPANGGIQFVARSLVFSPTERVSMQATSGVVTQTETVTRGTNTQTLVQNAALGAAAAAAISAVTGDRSVTTGDLLTTVGTGILNTLINRFSGQNQVELLVIEPETDLSITLQEDLIVMSRN